ncbi:MAG TPA: hypothetical protein VK158_03195 [Acidobacteriota bacterium]|nr:hypothetical protein [Acidobacteriota bacterium]
MGLKPSNKKAVFFIIDAIICATILLAAISLLVITPTQSAGQPKSFFLSKDIMHVLETVHVSDLYNQGNPWVVAANANGSITDLSQNIISQMGQFWAQGDDVLANEFIVAFLNQTIPDYSSFGIWIENESIYTRTNPPIASQSVAWRIVSGVEKNKPTRGFIANARATKVRSNSTYVVTLSPSGAGWDEGFYDVTKYFNLTNLTLLEAKFIVSLNSGTQQNDMIMNFNDGLCQFRRDDFTWYFLDVTGNVGEKNVSTSCFVNGTNKLYIEFEHNGYNAHLQPGTGLFIKYTSEVPISFTQTQFSRRYYFDNIRSREIGNDGAGVWATMPFVIPKDAQNLSVYAQIATSSVRDYISGARCRVLYNGARLNDPCASYVGWDGTMKDPSATDVMFFLNSDTPLLVNGSPSATATYKFSNTNLSPYLKNGTNIMAVYLNSYGDHVWGNGNPTIFSDIKNNYSTSSYIEVNYTLSINNIIPYGEIEIAAVEKINGSNEVDSIRYFNYPASITQVGDTYFHLVEKDSDKISVWADIYNPPSQLHFSSPSQRAVPSSIFIDSDYFQKSSAINNYVRVKETTYQILNISQIERRFFVPSYVGYGAVFATQAEADADALARLQAVMGGYIQANGFLVTGNIITDVPSLWGPIVVEVRAWD